MKKKIVVLYQRTEDKEKLAQIFEEAIQQGLEIFFCDNLEAAEKLIATENPELLIMEPKLELPPQKTPTLNFDIDLKRPLEKEQVLSQALVHLDLAHLENPQEIPM